MCACSLYRYIGGIGCPATCYGYFASSFLSIIFFFFCSIALIFRSIFPFFSQTDLCVIYAVGMWIFTSLTIILCALLFQTALAAPKVAKLQKFQRHSSFFFLLLRFVLYIPGSLIFNKKRSKLFRIFESVFFLVHML